MNTVKIRKLILGDKTPKICVPIVSTEDEDILKDAADITDTSCDIIELRADLYGKVHDENALIFLLKKLRMNVGEFPLLFTVRTSREGGNIEVSYKEYEQILLTAAKSGYVDAIDVECFMEKESLMRGLIEEIHKYNVCVIGSNHDFSKTPAIKTLKEKLMYMSSIGADVPKLAVMPLNRHDVINLLMATYEVSNILDKPVITMSMGKLGVVSRISGELFGSALTFGSFSEASAPGQIEVNTLKNVLDILKY